MRIATGYTYYLLMYLFTFLFFIHLFIPLSLPQFVFGLALIRFPIFINRFTTVRVAFIHHHLKQIRSVIFVKLYSAYDDIDQQ